MKSAIESIYYGEYEQYEAEIVSEEYQKLSEQYSELYTDFEKELTVEQQEILRELWMKSAGMEAECSLERFREGVKLGIRLMTETLA